MARILIAEDEEALRALTARALTDSGHEVVTAVDGADALDILTREGGRFDLLLTDIRMPLMDGIALALATARDYPAIIILLMTAYADQRERASNLDALIHDVILKPFTLAEIKAAVSDALAAGKQLRSPQSRSRTRSEILQQPLDVVELELRPQPDRRSACATLPGCGARAARRSRPAPSR